VEGDWHEPESSVALSSHGRTRQWRLIRLQMTRRLSRGRTRGTVLSGDLRKSQRTADVVRMQASPKEQIMSRTSQLRYASAFGLSLIGVFFTMAWGRDTQAMTPEKVEQQYGVAGAYADSVATPDGSIKGTVVPVTLADGRGAQLVIPTQSAKDPHGVYMRDSNGLHPVQVSERANRNDVARAPAVVETRPDQPHAKKRSWEKDALIIGGSAGAGTLIGAVAGGKKGAAIGATAGGVGGLIYDLASRDRDRVKP
jgi:hypothetical protein